MSNIGPIFVTLTKRGADLRMAGGVAGSLYQVNSVTRAASGMGLNVYVISKWEPETFNKTICMLSSNGDYELLYAKDHNRLMTMALQYEAVFLQNYYADETANMMWEDDRNPTEFEQQNISDDE